MKNRITFDAEMYKSPTDGTRPKNEVTADFRSRCIDKLSQQIDKIESPEGNEDFEVVVRLVYNISDNSGFSAADIHAPTEDIRESISHMVMKLEQSI